MISREEMLRSFSLINIQYSIEKLAILSSGHFTYLAKGLPELPDELLEICMEWNKEEINTNLKDTKVSNILFQCYPFHFSLLTLILPWCNESFQSAIKLLLDKGIEVKLGDMFFLAHNKTAFDELKPLTNIILNRFDTKHINDTISSSGNTLLHEIARFDKKRISWELMDFLLSQSANVNIKNKAGNTPLHIAFEKKNTRLFFKLLLSGCDVNVENEMGISVLNLLKQLRAVDGKIIEIAVQSLTDENDGHLVNEEIFRSQIRQFLDRHHLERISDIFSDPRSCKPLIRSFFSNIKIVSYLTRSMSFDNSEYPDYLDIEHEFYEAASQPEKKSNVAKKSFVLVPYRSDLVESSPIQISEREKSMKSSSRFYARGTHAKSIKSEFDIIKKSLPNLKDYFHLVIPENYKMGIHISLMAKASSLSCNERGYAYVISAAQKSGHVFAMLSLINTRNKKVQFHVVIDTDIGGSYSYINSGVDLTRNAPVFNGSLSIQLAKDDGNCGLYTIRICKALCELLNNNPDLQEKLELLTLLPSVTWENLKTCFHHGLKEKLPELFAKQENGDFLLLSYDKLKESHLKKRWEIGSHTIFSKHEKYRIQLQEEYESFKVIGGIGFVS